MPAVNPRDLVDALVAIDMSSNLTTPARYTEVLQTVLEPPTVGVALDHLSLSQDGTPVTGGPTPTESMAAAVDVTFASRLLMERVVGVDRRGDPRFDRETLSD